MKQVEYLGSVALNRQSSDLMALQQPLKELYIKYLAKDDDEMRKNLILSDNPDERHATLPGSIEISKTGLKVGVVFIIDRVLRLTKIL